MEHGACHDWLGHLQVHQPEDHKGCLRAGSAVQPRNRLRSARSRRPRRRIPCVQGIEENEINCMYRFCT